MSDRMCYLHNNYNGDYPQLLARIYGSGSLAMAYARLYFTKTDLTFMMIGKCKRLLNNHSLGIDKKKILKNT